LITCTASSAVLPTNSGQHVFVAAVDICKQKINRNKKQNIREGLKANMHDFYLKITDKINLLFSFEKKIYHGACFNRLLRRKKNEIHN
jgi:hypothetical protein